MDVHPSRNGIHEGTKFNLRENIYDKMTVKTVKKKNRYR